MAGKEFLRGDDLLGGRAAFGLARGYKDIRERDKQNMVVDRRALRGYRAFEEGGKEGV